MNSTHTVKVVRIPDIEKHPNADSLGLVHLGGYQVVVKLGDFKPGDFALYIQPDSVVPEEPQYAFLWEGRAPATDDCSVPEKYRRITVRKFRKEWSEGLLLPVENRSGSAFVRRGFKVLISGEGDDVAEFLGITHYQPPEPGERQQSHNYGRGVWPRSLKGWYYFILRKLGFDVNGPTGDNMRAPKTFPPVYDVEAFKNFPNAFEPGETVVVTEKIHGSNARYTFQNGKMYAGSRQLWKSEKSNCIWRKVLEQHPWIEEWCRTHPGYTIFGEVVPTQGKFTYGCKPGETKFFVFDILSPSGEWTRPSDLMVGGIKSQVPLLYAWQFDEQKIRKLADGFSAVVGADQIREGVVIRATPERHVRGIGRLQLKIVSNQFLEQS